MDVEGFIGCTPSKEDVVPEHDLTSVIQQDHAALKAFMHGDPEPKKRLYSRADDATLANPLGPAVRGWDAISRRLDEASSTLQGGGALDFERVSAVSSPDLAYVVDVERYRGVTVEGSEGPREFSLRVTTIFRHEAEGWKIVHRHADPITTPRDVGTMLD